MTVRAEGGNVEMHYSNIQYSGNSGVSGTCEVSDISSMNAYIILLAINIVRKLTFPPNESMRLH